MAAPILAWQLGMGVLFRCKNPGSVVTYLSGWGLLRFSGFKSWLSHATCFWIILGATSVKRDFPGSSVGKESACNSGDPSLIPGLGSSPEEGIGYPL